MASASASASAAGRTLAYLQTIEHTHVPLNNIKRLRLFYNQIGAGNTTIRHFIRDRLPLLRFHNPQLQCELQVNKNRINHKLLHQQQVPHQQVIEQSQELAASKLAEARDNRQQPATIEVYTSSAADSKPMQTLQTKQYPTDGDILRALLEIDGQRDLIPRGSTAVAFESPVDDSGAEEPAAFLQRVKSTAAQMSEAAKQ